jgi:hypothetical protein
MLLLLDPTRSPTPSVPSKISSLNHPLSRPLSLFAYIPSHNRVYLTDKDHYIWLRAFSQRRRLRGDTEVVLAAEILPTLPKDQLNKVDSLKRVVRLFSPFSPPPTFQPYSQLTRALQPINRPQRASTPNDN